MDEIVLRLIDQMHKRTEENRMTRKFVSWSLFFSRNFIAGLLFF